MSAIYRNGHYYGQEAVTEPLSSAEMQDIKYAFDACTLQTPDTASTYDLIDLRGTERVCGKLIESDGTVKPIYCQTISLGALTNASSTTTKTLVSLGVVVDKYVGCDGMMYDGSGWSSPIPYYSSSDISVIPALFDNHHSNSSNRNKVSLTYKGSLSWVTDTTLTVKYTKTS